MISRGVWMEIVFLGLWLQLVLVNAELSPQYHQFLKSLQTDDYNRSSFPLWFIPGMHEDTHIFMTKGLVHRRSRTIHSFITEKECNCRQACWAYPPCMSVSSVQQGDRFVCQLSDKSPSDSGELWLYDNATYIFKRPVLSKFYTMGNDNMIYVVPDVQKSFWNARKYCARIPGHRLAIFHTQEQFRVVIRVYELENIPVWLDLTFSKGKIIWGDRTPLEDTDLEPYLELENGTGTKRWIFFGNVGILSQYHGPQYFLCQGKINGFDW